MYDTPTYNHASPEINRAEPGTSFFHRAAKISLWISLLVIVLSNAVSHALNGQHGKWVTNMNVAVAALLGLLLVSGLVLAVIALCGIPKYGTEGIVIKALCGIVLNLLFLGLMGAGFIQGFETALKNREAVAEVTNASRELQEQNRDEFRRSGTIRAESAQSKIAKMKNALDAVADKGSRDTALAAQAAKGYIEKLQPLITDYAAAEKAIMGPPAVLDFSNVTSREQLQQRRRAAEKFVAANEKLMAFFKDSESVYRGELARFKVPQATAEAALKGFRAKAKDRNYIVVKIRETDHRVGNATLCILDLLSGTWGEWKYDAEKKAPVFSAEDTQAKYNAHLKEIRSAAFEQAQWQAQLVNSPIATSDRQ